MCVIINTGEIQQSSDVDASAASAPKEDREGDLEDEADRDRHPGRREYLKEMLSAHHIWHNGNFWEQALWQCAIEQVLNCACLEECSVLRFLSI